MIFWLYLAGVFGISFTDFNLKHPLKGAVTYAVLPDFDIRSWFDGSFQQNFDKFVNDDIGFRPWLVRLRNQIAWSLFGKRYAAGVIKGKNNYLYELNYINAYNGVDFLGADTIRQRTLRIKQLSDKLEERGKTLLVCIAPGKGSFYPEFFPDNMPPKPTQETNYHYYLKMLKEHQVHVLDFNGWFLQMKNRSECILYPQYGIHWSYYGMILATDSLIKHVEQIRNIDMPNMVIGEIRKSQKLQPLDYDIARGLNLIFKLPTVPMCYPQFEWEDNTGKVQPQILAVSDSFYWSMEDIGIGTKSFSGGGFWFYNHEIYPTDSDKPLYTKTAGSKRIEIIDKTDVIILMATEATIPRFSWGFVETTLADLDSDKNIIDLEEDRILENEIESALKNEIESMIRDIKTDKKWMKDIQKKAQGKRISVDSMLVLDAMWLINEQKNNQ